MFHAEWREKWAKRPRRRGKLGEKAGGSATRAVGDGYSVFFGVWEGMIRKLGAILEKVQRF